MSRFYALNKSYCKARRRTSTCEIQFYQFAHGMYLSYAPATGEPMSVAMPRNKLINPNEFDSLFKPRNSTSKIAFKDT